MSELMQEVKLFKDSEKTGKQFVNIEKNWITVTHDGGAITLSIENWLKLVELSETAIKGKLSYKNNRLLIRLIVFFSSILSNSKS